MYRTCLFCTHDLGSNEVLEHLPIGRRIAFDSAKGRLWVVCRSCEQWNLVPFDSRLEAIDTCERHFRSTRTRFSTDNIGIARLGEGLDLVRIGPALRPEFAAWRYGDEFTHRRRRAVLGAGAATIGAASYLVVGVATAMGITAGAGAALLAIPALDLSLRAVRTWRRYAASSATLPDPRTGEAAEIPFDALKDATLFLSKDQTWSLEVPYHPQDFRLDPNEPALPSVLRTSYARFGEDKLFPALGRVLPAFNAGGGSQWRVREAVRCLEAVPDARSLLSYVIGRPLRQVTSRSWAVSEIHDDVRLALEMAAHEETERRAMEGELSLLERRWRDAELLAAIADGMQTESVSMAPPVAPVPASL